MRENVITSDWVQTTGLSERQRGRNNEVEIQRKTHRNEPTSNSQDVRAEQRFLEKRKGVRTEWLGGLQFTSF